MLLYYLRHGDPVYEPNSLTPLGHKQAQALAKRLSVYGFDKIFCSTSERAKLTCRPTCENLHITPTYVDWADENLTAQYFFLPYDKRNGEGEWVFRQDGYRKLFNSQKIFDLKDAWATAPEFKDTPMRQGKEILDKHIDEFLLSLGYKHDRQNRRYIPVSPTEERIALFAHEGFGAFFMSSVLDIPYPEYSTRYSFSHSSMSVINFEVQDGVVIPNVLMHSSDSHIYKEGLPTHYQNKYKI